MEKTLFLSKNSLLPKPNNLNRNIYMSDASCRCQFNDRFAKTFVGIALVGERDVRPSDATFLIAITFS